MDDLKSLIEHQREQRAIFGQDNPADPNCPDCGGKGRTMEPDPRGDGYSPHPIACDCREDA